MYLDPPLDGIMMSNELKKGEPWWKKFEVFVSRTNTRSMTKHRGRNARRTRDGIETGTISFCGLDRRSQAEANRVTELETHAHRNFAPRPDTRASNERRAAKKIKRVLPTASPKTRYVGRFDYRGG